MLDFTKGKEGGKSEKERKGPKTNKMKGEIGGN